MNYRLLVAGDFWPEYRYISKRVKNWPTKPTMHVREKFLSLMRYNLFMAVYKMRLKILLLLCQLRLVLQLGSV